MSTISRTIHYYDLHFKFNNDGDPQENFRNLFSTITIQSQQRDPERYINLGNKSLFINDIRFHPEKKQIRGILRLVRKDALPLLMDTTTDETTDLNLLENQGLVENTHFLIDYTKKIKKLVLEYNQFGAKLSDLCFYLEDIGIKKCDLVTLTPMYITNDNVQDTLAKANMISEFVIKVHKSHIAEVANSDRELATVLENIQQVSDSDYATLTLKYDVQQRSETTRGNKLMQKLIGAFTSNEKNKNAFNILQIRAQNGDNYNRLETFDLLVDKLSSHIRVDRKVNYKSILSDDMFAKMENELLRKGVI